MTNNIHLRNTLLLLVLTHAPLAAQNTSVNTRPDRGWLPTGVFSGSDLGSVNQVSGNLGVRIPITALPPETKTRPSAITVAFPQ